jgi:lambda family phage portal protein
MDGYTFAGIEYNGAGRRTAYWLFETHPDLAVLPKSHRIDAENVLHVFKPVEPGYERGVSWLAPVLLPLRELQAYLEATLLKAKASACFMGVVRSPRGVNPLAGPGKLFELEPLTTVRLDNDEDITWSDPPDIETAFDPFVRASLRKIASGMNMPYEILASDHSSVTFASGRHGLLDWRRHIESVQYNILVHQCCRPVLERWLKLGIALGLVPDADFSDVRWIGPQLAMLDPGKEVAALRDQVRAGFISRSEVVRMNGWNSETVDDEIAADNSRANRLGLVFDSDPRKTSQQGQKQQEVTENASE